MKAWKWTRVLRRIATVAKNASIRKLFAAPDASPQVDAARNRWRREELLQRRAARGAERFELGGERLQALERRGLRMVERRAARREDRIDPGDERARARTDIDRGVSVVHRTQAGAEPDSRG